MTHKLELVRIISSSTSESVSFLGEIEVETISPDLMALAQLLLKACKQVEPPFTTSFRLQVRP